jgi:general secretion pathway protein G
MVRRDKHTAVRGGFTLMELLVVVAIIVVLAGVAVPMYMGRLEDAKKDRAKVDVKTLTQQCLTYQLKYGDMPATLEVLCQPQPDGSIPFLEPSALLDPWNRPYEYQPQGQHNAMYGKPDIWSLGPNPGDAAGIIGNWSAAFQGAGGQ